MDFFSVCNSKKCFIESFLFCISTECIIICHETVTNVNMKLQLDLIVAWCL